MTRHVCLSHQPTNVKGQVGASKTKTRPVFQRLQAALESASVSYTFLCQCIYIFLKRYPTILTRKWSFNTVMLNPKYTIPSQLCVLAVHCDFPYFDLQYWYSPPKKTELLLCHRGVYRRCSVCFCQSVEAGKSPHGNLQKYSFLNVFILE